MIEHIQVCNHDVFISFAKFPRKTKNGKKLKGFLVSVPEGYNIILNENLTYDQIVKTIHHEIAHIIENHMNSIEKVELLEKSI